MTCLTISLGICAAAILLILAFTVSPIALLFFIPNSLMTSKYTILIL